MKLAASVVETWLGAVLVVRSPEGIVALQIYDGPDLAVDAARQYFPTAYLSLRATDVPEVLEAIDDPSMSIDLSIDPSGTAFQMRVWEALRSIPAGATATYGEVAQVIEKPRAVRAVASACGRNPIAVLIPCHRVLPAAGGLGGYHWGPWRKAALLKREGVFRQE